MSRWTLAGAEREVETLLGAEDSFSSADGAGINNETDMPVVFQNLFAGVQRQVSIVVEDDKI